MTTALVTLRFLKLFAVGMFFAGSTGGVLASEAADRKKFTFWLAAPGFGLTWLLGLILIGMMNLPILSMWVIGSMILSMVTLHLALHASMGDKRGGVVSLCLVLLSLAATMALMIFRPL